MAVINVVVAGGCLILLEGASSVAVATRRALRAGGVIAEVHHTRYDPVLGWVNARNVRLPDFYGAGATLTTDGSGFRTNGPDRRAAASVRLVCSGDSFTLGYGVDDAQTWPAFLESLDRSVSAVNMGQGGYGVGQAFLWYLRDGERLSHDVHVFAFITADFDRMVQSTLWGFAKPRFSVSEGRLSVENTPVPRDRAPAGARSAAWIEGLRSLRFVQIARGIFGLRGDDAGASAPSPAQGSPPAFDVFEAILDSLVSIHRGAGRHLVLLHLPDTDALRADPPPGDTAWRAWLKEQSALRDVPYLDLIERWRASEIEDLAGRFIGPEAPRIAGSAGHLSAEGNRLVATELLRFMRDHPALARLWEEPE